jgi:putative FmdB family regulatory protein
MPSYTYECKECKRVEEVVKPISKAEAKEKCPDCKKAMHRVYQPAEVVRDTYRRGHRMGAYPPLNGKTGDTPDVVQSRTEKKKWLEAQNKKHGWSLVYD